MQHTQEACNINTSGVKQQLRMAPAHPRRLMTSLLSSCVASAARKRRPGSSSSCRAGLSRVRFMSTMAMYWYGSALPVVGEGEVNHSSRTALPRCMRQEVRIRGISGPHACSLSLIGCWCDCLGRGPCMQRYQCCSMPNDSPPCLQRTRFT